MNESDFIAKSVYECWKIVREETEHYQELANESDYPEGREHYLEIRNVLDRVARRIKIGEQRED